MTSYVALLRAINVGKRRVAMSDLRKLFEKLDLEDPRTLLQSGNVVFRSDQTAAALELSLEKETAKRFGFEVEYFVRSAKDWKAIQSRNPFADFADEDPSHLVVLFSKKTLTKKKVLAVRSAIKGPELIEAVGKQAYVTYSAGIGASRLTNSILEAKLGSPMTGRNWNTVAKLARHLEV